MTEANLPLIRARIRRSLDRLLPRWVVPLCVAVLLFLPGWVFWDQLRYPKLAGDDFAYVADSRDLDRLIANLFEPHNTHIVPLFRVWTYVIVLAAGRLSEIAEAQAIGSYLTFSLALLAVRHLVVRVTRDQAAALIAMALLGLSTLNLTVVAWYSAGQALSSGTAIVATLIALESWLDRGKGWRLALAVLSALAAPGIWMGGLLAGPAAAAYLWFSDRPHRRRAASAFLLLALIVAGLLVGAVRSKMAEVGGAEGRRPGPVSKVFQALRSTTIAIPEALLFQNLGVDAPLTGAQGLVFCLALLWLWQRRGPRRPNRLEAAGLFLVVGSYLMIYFFRGYMAYEDMRVVGWYHAIPAIGADLWAVGWWWSSRGPEAARATPAARLSMRGLLAVLGFTVGMIALHLPRAERLLIAGAPQMTSSEASRFLIPELQRLRALVYAEAHAGRQRRALLKLEQAEQTARRLGVGRLTIRQVFGRVLVPGIPELQKVSDAASLLALPDADWRPVDSGTVRQALARYLVQEPAFRPPWLAPSEALPQGP